MANRYILIVLVHLLSLINLFGQSYDWAINLQGSSLFYDYSYDLSLDPNGNSYIIGSFRETMDFDPSAGVANLTSAGEDDIFLAKYDVNGNYLWAFNIGSSRVDYGYSLVADDIGNIYVTGGFSEVVDFDPSAGIANLTTGVNLNAIFIAKYDALGNYIWAFEIGGINGGSNYGYSIELDESGNIYTTGAFSDPDADFDPSAGTAILPYDNSYDMYVAKYDANGNYIWAFSAGAGGWDRGYSLTVSNDNFIYVTGEFASTVDFDPSAATSSLTATSLDMFLAKYDTAGNYIWALHAESSGSMYRDHGYGVKSDKYNNVYVTGEFEDTVDFDPSANTNKLVSSGDYDIFIAKYDQMGNHLWAMSMGGADRDWGRSIALDHKENPYFTGCFQLTTDLDGTVGTDIYTSNGTQDLFISKYDQFGNYIWSLVVGGPSREQGRSIATDLYGNIYVTGIFADVCDFNPSSSIDTLSTSALNNLDIFVAKYKDTTVTSIGLQNKIRGIVYDDLNNNCIQDSLEYGLPNFLVKTEPSSFYAITDENGLYTIVSDTGSYSITPVVPSNKGILINQFCPDSLSLILDTILIDTSGFDFGVDMITCPYLTVDISSNRRRRCFTSTTTVNYYNGGQGISSNTKVFVEFPKYLQFISADHPWSIVADSVYEFDIGVLQPGDYGNLKITDKVICGNESIRGLTQCTKAWITPVNTCVPQDTTGWDKSSIKVQGNCILDSIIVMMIINAGSGDMLTPSDFRLYRDNVLIHESTFQLASGDTLVINIPGDGATYRLEADQHLKHPGKSKPRETIEGCGSDSTGTFTIGFVDQVPQDDADVETDIDCQQITDSYDPNDKQVSPSGILDANYVSPGLPLTFKIRFQNTGSDTAYNIRVEDELSNNLDISTLMLGISSHNYTTEIIGVDPYMLSFQFGNINLPDSNINEEGSHGYLTFSIYPKDPLPNGTVIENYADIYFDFNSPIRTNTTDVTIYDTIINSNVLCVYQDSSGVEVANPPVVSINNDTTICKGEMVQLMASGGNYYSWHSFNQLSDTSIANPIANPDTSGYYYVMVEHFPNSCGVPDSVFIQVDEYPNLNMISDTNICAGDTINLSATGGDIYSWSPSTGLNDPTIANPQAYPDSTTKYFLNVNEAGKSCYTIDSITITVDPLPFVTTSPDILDRCRIDTITISASGGDKIAWSPSTGLDDSTSYNPVVYIDNPITYYCTVTDTNNGCSIIDSIKITNMSLVSGPDSSICPGNSIQLYTTAGYSYSWQPDSTLSCSNCQNPIASPISKTTYYVTAFNPAEDCSKIDTVTIDVVSCVGIEELKDITNFNISPNPYKGITNISYSLMKSSNVTLEIYNVLGKRIVQLVSQQQLKGDYTYQVNTKKLGYSSSLYLVQFSIDDNYISMRIIEIQ